MLQKSFSVPHSYFKQIGEREKVERIPDALIIDKKKAKSCTKLAVNHAGGFVALYWRHQERVKPYLDFTTREVL
jgi:hypothetical protein